MKGTGHAPTHPVLELLMGAFRLSVLLPMFLIGSLGERGRDLCGQLSTTLRLATLLHSNPVERKALLLEWLVVGPVGYVISAETIMEIFGGRHYRDPDAEAEAEADADDEEYIFVDLDDRYDEAFGALFYLGALRGMHEEELMRVREPVGEPDSSKRRETQPMYYAYSVDEDGHVNPMFDSDVVAYFGDAGLARLEERSRSVHAEYPEMALEIVDLSCSSVETSVVRRWGPEDEEGEKPSSPV